MTNTVNTNPLSQYGYNDAQDFLSIREQKETLGVEDNTFIYFGYGVVDKVPTPPQTDRYLTFTANNNKCYVGIFFNGKTTPSEALNLEYSVDNGTTWETYTVSFDGEATMIPLDNEGDSVKFRGVNQTISTGNYYYAFTISGSVSATGDVTSILNGVGGDCEIPEYCYGNMFIGCIGLTTAPVLPATTLSGYCYGNMFKGCASLTAITCLATDISALNCTVNWVEMVAEDGVFTKAASMDSWRTGIHGIPSGWKVQEV